MRSLGNFFQQHSAADASSRKKEGGIDAKTIFFLFDRIVSDYYGKRGRGVIHPHSYQEKTLVVKVASPLWANELLIQESELCRRLNEAVGSEAVEGIRVFHGLHAD